MKPNAFIAFCGFVMLIAASYCPLFRPFHITNWNMYDCNKPYGITVLLVGVVGIIGIVFMQYKVARMAAWLSLVLVILFYVLGLLKIYTSFDLVPIHSVKKWMAHQVKFKWGWYLLCAAPLLSLFGVLRDRTLYKAPIREEVLD